MGNGGDLVAKVLQQQGVKFIFTLCGGHISPILVGAKKLEMRIIDVRHESTAIFAADAVSRLSGIPGVAVVTAGPGVTNTITAIRNAQLAQSPLVLIGGATATMLQGRGALQDIDQLSLFSSCVKWKYGITKIKEIPWALNCAFQKAQEGVPGPVFIQIPIDLLYDDELVRKWYRGKQDKKPQNIRERMLKWYIERHVNKMFEGKGQMEPKKPIVLEIKKPSKVDIKKLNNVLEKVQKPLMILGSQALLQVDKVNQVVEALEKLKIPVYLSGMARGLLGRKHRLLIRHNRKDALREADLVILAGVPVDFRLDYGRHLPHKGKYVGINRSSIDLKKNKKPWLAMEADPAETLLQLTTTTASNWENWADKLRQRDRAREDDILVYAEEENGIGINPLKMHMELDMQLDEKSIIIADGGDFVATASYILQPRRPLSWLDPGVFGTLGVGAGFAIGAKLVRPEAEVWLIWGDGSAGYSIAEFDTMVRHNLPIIAVVGNDASWAQIARDQVEILKDDVGTVLQHTDYQVVAKGFGGDGSIIFDKMGIALSVAAARHATASGKPFLINAILSKSNFRNGSISM
jgi:acetolactate synthase-like protein